MNIVACSVFYNLLKQNYEILLVDKNILDDKLLNPYGSLYSIIIIIYKKVIDSNIFFFFLVLEI